MSNITKEVLKMHNSGQPVEVIARSFGLDLGIVKNMVGGVNVEAVEGESKDDLMKRKAEIAVYGCLDDAIKVFQNILRFADDDNPVKAKVASYVIDTALQLKQPVKITNVTNNILSLNQRLELAKEKSAQARGLDVIEIS